MGKKRKKGGAGKRAVCAFLLLAIGLVFGQTIHHDFVNYDDPEYVYNNQQVVRGLTAEGFGWAFTHTRSANWHPLTWISHMLDCQLYGLHPGGHHLTNLLLHAATAILLFLLLLRMTDDFWPSAFVAVVFAIHPLRVESVAWISERKDVLSGLFFMLTLRAYVEYVRHPLSIARYTLVCALFALGLMAKPMLVTLPFVLLLLDYWPLRRIVPLSAHDHRVGNGWHVGQLLIPTRVVLEKLPLLGLVAISCVLTFWAQHDALEAGAYLPLPWRLGNALVSYVVYLVQLAYPVGLAVYYPHPAFELPVWEIIGASLVLLAITAGVLANGRKRPYLLVGWCWYLGTLIPVIGLVQVGHQAMADRYTYLTQIGVLIALAWGAAHSFRSWPSRNRFYGIASALIILALMGGAWRQTTFWKNSETLWTHTLACTSKNTVAHNNLGVALFARRDLNGAITHYREALKIRPDYAEAHNNLGNALALQGQLKAAIIQFREAIKITPDYAQAHLNLGHALALQEQTDEAVKLFRKALQIKPDYAEAHYNLGIALASKEQAEEAITHYKQAIQLKPNYVDAYNNLAWLRATWPEANLRDGAQAVELAQRALRFSAGEQPGLLDTLAAAYAEAGHFPKAVETARKAIILARRQNNQALAANLQARLSLYEAGTAYHEKSPAR